MKKEIVFVTTSFARGGAEAQLIRLASRLWDRGWELRIISMLNSAPVPEDLSRRGVEVVFLGMKRGAPGPRAVFRVAALLQRWRPPILATFNFPANMLGRVAGALAGVPVIVSSIRNERFGGVARDTMMRITGGIDSVTTTNSRLAA
ncbi:MAG: glycosyltransferase, partial [Opitutales bacterium]